MDDHALNPRVLLCVDMCRVKLGAGGMDALIRLGCGDMRRTLNILQVRLHGQPMWLSRVLWLHSWCQVACSPTQGRCQQQWLLQT